MVMVILLSFVMEGAYPVESMNPINNTKLTVLTHTGHAQPL